MDKTLENTIFDRYRTIIFDLDKTLWQATTPNGDSIGAYETTSPYSLKDSRTIVDIKGNVIELQEGVREMLALLNENDKNLGIMSRGEKLLDVNMRLSAPFEAQPSTQLLKKFDIYKYFNYVIIYKAFAEKIQYVRPSGLTLFIDDDRQWIDQVKQRDDIDVLWRGAFSTWQSLIEPPKQDQKLSWRLLTRTAIKPGSYAHLILTFLSNKIEQGVPNVEIDRLIPNYQTRMNLLNADYIEQFDGPNGRQWSRLTSRGMEALLFIDNEEKKQSKLSWNTSNIDLQVMEGESLGMSFYVGKVRIPYSDLVRVLGEPSLYDSAKGKYIEWPVKTLDNKIKFTIYNESRHGLWEGSDDPDYKNLAYWKVNASTHTAFDAIDKVIQMNFNKELYR